MFGIILAKKKSERLALNKALIEIEGETLIERTIRIIKPYCKDILIISDDERLNRFGKRFEDIFKEKGPISGIYTGLYYSEEEENLVLASDMPFLKPSLIEYIIRNTKYKNVGGDFQAIIPEIEGKKEPLCAIYLKGCLPLIKEEIENNRLSLKGLIERLNVKYVDCDEFRDCFFNLNTKEDLILARKEAHRN
ncbi:MAG: molybdenum cofactor guanylyltransferase [bacterium]